MAKKKATCRVVIFKKQPKKDGTFPLKLRITYLSKQIYYGIGLSYTEGDWTKINSQNARNEYRAIKLKLIDIEEKAQSVIDHFEENDEEFSFPKFEEIYFNQQNNTEYIFEAYKERIETLKSEGRISSATADSCALNSFETYFNHRNIKFKEITPKTLTEYERWMLNEQKNSSTTVGVYMRSLRTLFNEQIAKGLLEGSYYPFGKYKYQIPTTEIRDKVIKKEDLQKLYEYEAKMFSNEDMARDLWFFLYLCNGMNIKDMCRLKYSAFRNDHFVFVRAKTEAKNKYKKEITVILNDTIKGFIEKWGNQNDGNPDTYVFPFYPQNVTPEDERRITQNLTGVINDNMNRIAKKLELGINITTYSARQTFSDVMMNSNAPIKLIADSLGHANTIITEKHYAKQMNVEKQKEFNKALLDFE